MMLKMMLMLMIHDDSEEMMMGNPKRYKQTLLKPSKNRINP